MFSFQQRLLCKNTSSFFSFALVIRLVSHPYNSTECTLELKISILVLLPIKLNVRPDPAQLVTPSPWFSKSSSNVFFRTAWPVCSQVHKTSRMSHANNISVRSYVRHRNSMLAGWFWKLAKHHPGTKYIRKTKGHTLQSKNIHKNIFSVKSAEK